MQMKISLDGLSVVVLLLAVMLFAFFVFCSFLLLLFVLSVLTATSTSLGARVLVAGGTGIVGSGIVQALLRQGARVSSSFTASHKHNC